MNGKQHFKGYYLLMIPVAVLIYMYWQFIFFVPLIFMFMIVNPDFDISIDINIGKGKSMVHRLAYTHSLILPAMIAYTFSMIAKEALRYYYNIQIEVTMLFMVMFKYCIVPTIIHLTLDLRVRSKKMRGTYTIVYFFSITWKKGIHPKRMSGKMSTLWLWINIIIGIIILIIV